MSGFNVPSPDYDITVRQKGPYIPTPDYTTIKYYKAKSRPSLDNLSSSPSQNLYIDTNLNRNFNNNNISSRLAPLKQENPQLRPSLAGNEPNYNRFSKHSYLEDHIENGVHPPRNTKEHIKHIGVPVIPGIIPGPVSAPNDINAPHVSSDQNKAFLRHLENHQKYDTIKGNRGIDDCEICHIMKQQLAEEQKASSNYAEAVNIASRRQRADVRYVFPQIEELPEPEPTFSSMSARARYNYEQKRESELSVYASEEVQILEVQQGLALCRKADNTVGWIPSHVFGI
ncbi:unnamed protein product [Caenorhabditis bovis]|uniref:SH3 domain-containing protein n=1 Tax=Caenorhabditis bovis TaxID=2654633 RepID=A0A8S1F8N9_9PELO|nr:unnamed protein product [Caenorhabditis bovis]